MQSPLLPKIGILDAAGFQEVLYGADIAETRMTIALQGEILLHINSFVENFSKMYQEAIQSVLHLVILEVKGK